MLRGTDLVLKSTNRMAEDAVVVAKVLNESDGHEGRTGGELDTFPHVLAVVFVVHFAEVEGLHCVLRPGLPVLCRLGDFGTLVQDALRLDPVLQRRLGGFRHFLALGQVSGELL